MVCQRFACHTLRGGKRGQVQLLTGAGFWYSPMRILSYCLVRIHWHFVLCPDTGELARFMRRLTVTHMTRRQ
jgi:hypothetical protein